MQYALQGSGPPVVLLHGWPQTWFMWRHLGRCWHWLFHMQPDLPELLVCEHIEAYLRYLFARWTYRRDALEDVIGVYVAAFSQPVALRAGFEDYRASEVDVAVDDRSYDAGDRVTVRTRRGAIGYRVTGVTVYRKATLTRDAERVFSQSVPGRLVLITCEEWNGSRYLSNAVVFADPI